VVRRPYVKVNDDGWKEEKKASGRRFGGGGGGPVGLVGVGAPMLQCKLMTTTTNKGNPTSSPCMESFFGASLYNLRGLLAYLQREFCTFFFLKKLFRKICYRNLIIS
jgi:hypothetical protein